MDEVKDQELDTAAEAVEGTPVEETVEETNEEEKEEEGAEEEEGTEETKEVDEPGDNAERSKLGRKVSGLEKRIENLTAQLETASRGTEEIVEFDEEMPMTLKDLKAFMAKEKDTETSTKQKYDNEYIREFMRLSDEEDEVFATKVMDEMEANYNSIYSIDGTADAEKNWLKAQAAVLRKGTEKKNPLKGKKSAVATGVTGGDKVTGREYKMPKLDEDAQDLIKKSNFTEEDIKDALEGRNMNTTGEKNMKNV